MDQTNSYWHNKVCQSGKNLKYRWDGYKIEDSIYVEDLDVEKQIHDTGHYGEYQVLSH